MGSIVRVIVAAIIGSCSPAESSTCTTGIDLVVLARNHKAAWSGAFDGRKLLDSELSGLADGQAVLECLAAQAAGSSPSQARDDRDRDDRHHP